MRRIMLCLPRCLWVVLLAAGLASCGAPRGDQRQLVVYAAASLRDVVADLGADFERRHGVLMVYNFAGSNTLAQQIRAAPGADVFLSADEAWVDFLDQAERTVADTRRGFLSNSLVLIARPDAGLDISDPRDLAGAEPRFLAVADPQAVPAGRYARAALERIEFDGGSLWSALAAKIAPTLDVRATLALVESDPEIAGIVYQTDALTSEKVRVLYELETPGDMPIRYVAARVKGSASAELGRQFLDFIRGAPARAIARRHGFGAPEPVPDER